MVHSNRHVLAGAVFGAVCVVAVYVLWGTLRPVAQWRWLDLMSEGGTALLTAWWLYLVLGSRPAGRVTLLLAMGLAAIALGMGADALDEVLPVQQGPRVDKWIESGLVPIGMLLLSAGLMGWRREQFALSEHMQRRERVFREHRDFDRITQLAGIDYLREQVALERRRHPSAPAALAMLEIEGLQEVLHEQGRRGGVRALQCVTHQILLNLRHDDLLCRYSGDRFVLLLPRTDEAEARRVAQHLARMVGLMTFFDDHGGRAVLGLRHAHTQVTGEADVLLSTLNREIEATALSPTTPVAA